jgi:sterol desaturase/sphingolipid hydroxylase (fatty acid hydroxylase superfamily)
MAWQIAIGYVIITFIYYWWHRFRHNSRFFWRVCHQLHHSPQRMEVLMSFYKHPVEITINGLLSSSIMYLLLGCSPEAAGLITLTTGVAEYFYHWDIKTPYWLGPFFQRPESHRVHHQRAHHTNNYSDIPLWDMLFGTYQNPKHPITECGFDPSREDRFDDMLAFRDVHRQGTESLVPLHFLPTCIGCSKRWACQRSQQQVIEESS